MPLTPGNNEHAFVNNVKELFNANKNKPAGKKRSRAQILAISYAQKRKSK